MGRLQIYILQQLILSTLVATAVLGSVVWLTQSLRFVDMIVYRNLSLSTFLGFTLLLLPSLLMIIGPVGLFIATLYTYHRMYNDRELVILQASGLSAGFAARPAILLALFLTMFGYLNALYMMPGAFRHFKNLQRLYRTELSSLAVQEGVFNSIMPGVTLFVRERFYDGELQGLVIHDERNLKRPETVIAERGRIATSDDRIHILLTNGNRQAVVGDGNKLSLFSFDSYQFEILADKHVQTSFSREPRERYLSELFISPEAAGSRFSHRKLRMEGIYRLSSPLLYLACAFVAFGMLLTGGFSRDGHRNRIILTVPVVLALHILLFGAKYLGERLPLAEILIFLFPLGFIAVFAVMLWRPGLIRQLLPTRRPVPGRAS